MVKESSIDEYIERHNEIWPEMKETLSNVGIKNYTVWNIGIDSVNDLKEEMIYV